VSARIPARGRREGYRIGDPASVTDLATGELRRRIVTGVLPMGQHLHEQPLADEIGVGRAALREALRTLERDGLVVHVPRAGSRVVQLTLSSAHQIVVVREHLEELALAQGVPAPAPGVLEALRQAVTAMRATAAAGREDDAALDGVRFHRAFIALAGNPYLDGAFSTIAHPLGILMHLNRSVAAAGESLAARADRHARLVERIIGGNPDDVRREMRGHGTTDFLSAGVLDETGASEATLAWAGR